MRTTVNIDEELLAEARQLAVQKRASLGDVVDDALRAYLAERTRPVVDFSWGDIAIEVPGGQGMRPGINWRSNAALLEYMEDG